MPSPWVSGGTTWRPPATHNAGLIAAAQRAELLVGRRWRRASVHIWCSIDDEAAAFERVMVDRHLDLVGEDRSHHRARKLGGDVDLLVLRHQGVAGERIAVLPAGERADSPHGGLDDVEAGAACPGPGLVAPVERRRDLRDAAERGGRRRRRRVARYRAIRRSQHGSPSTTTTPWRGAEGPTVLGHRPRHHHGIVIRAGCARRRSAWRRGPSKYRMTQGTKAPSGTRRAARLFGGLGDGAEHLGDGSAGAFRGPVRSAPPRPGYWPPPPSSLLRALAESPTLASTFL